MLQKTLKAVLALEYAIGFGVSEDFCTLLCTLLYKKTKALTPALTRQNHIHK